MQATILIFQFTKMTINKEEINFIKAQKKAPNQS
jgi:hypothetical protein